MFVNFSTRAIAFIVALAASSATAMPTVGPQQLIVFNPNIIAPKEHASWPRGSQQVVKWETTAIPAQRVNSTGVLLLGYLENNSENLDIDNPLATGFPIKDGAVKVKMPSNVPARDDYFVVLFGDSGNKSPKFIIH